MQRTWYLDLYEPAAQASDLRWRVGFKGMGIYLMDKPTGASGLRAYQVTLAESARILDERDPPHRQKLLRFFAIAPKTARELFLEESGHRAAEPAMRPYLGQRTMHEALMLLYLDLYGGHTSPWAAAIATIGYDAVHFETEGLLLVYNRKVLSDLKEVSCSRT